MGTRSFIAHRTSAGYEGVYCHWDGYLSHNGKILREHYSDPEVLSQLIAHGSISSLGETIGTQHDFDNRPEGMTTFYHRDRNESWDHNQPRQFQTVEALRNYAENCGYEYLYLLDATGWQYAEREPQLFGLSEGSAFSLFQSLPESLDD